VHGDRRPRHICPDEGGRLLKAPSNWFETFFSGLAVDFWRAVVPEEATAEDVEFLWKHLGLSAGSRVLDVPCGAGRLAIPLASRGCAMTGVDISPEFLAAAQEGRRVGSGSIRFRQADMRDLPWSDEFDAAFCFGNSFGYLDDAGNEAFLHAVARALLPGGRFAIDYGQTAESVLPRLEPRQEADMAGFHFVEDTRYDPVSGRIENRFMFSRGGRTETKLASQRVYTLSELVRLLANAGFQVGKFYGSPREDPFGLASPRLLILAEKPA
jgi:SAM-dependent methyltransferase